MSGHPVSGIYGLPTSCNTIFRLPIAFAHFHFISLLIHSILINLKSRRMP